MNNENKVFLKLYQESNKDIPNMQLIDAPVLGMSDNEFNYALKILQDKKIISGLRVTKGYDGKIIRVYTSNVQLTENAEEYYKNLYPIEENKIQKKKKIFISHASNDLSYVKLLVEFMESINVPEKGIFCSSLPEYGIPLGENIYEYIRKQALEYEIKMYLILSDNFCSNSSCRTELGLLLTLELKNISFYLPGFDLRNTPRELNPQIMGIKLDDNIDIVKMRLKEIRDDLLSFFNLPKISEEKWERKRDMFICELEKLSVNTSK